MLSIPALFLVTCAVVSTVGTIGSSANENEINKTTTAPRGRARSGRLSDMGQRGGAVYVRWGRTNCSTDVDTELIYHGFTGGTHYTSTGGASNLLCLPHDPQWGSYNESPDGMGEVYGAEYETASHPFTLRQGGPRTLQNQNAPCAVCRSRGRGSMLMIPARKECYEGWTREYWGYLTSGHKAHKGRTQYTCMDAQPDADMAGYRDENGALFYSVEAICGSLPCPPYINGRELACVVCTK